MSKRRPVKVLWVLLLTAAVLAGCETTNPEKARIKPSISSPEWEIEEEMLAYTPHGMSSEEVLEFVNTRLVHSQKEDSESDDIYVYVDDGSDSKYVKELNYKLIQVYTGLHGAVYGDTNEFLLNSNWVYISWLFENNKLIDIVVTKVIPNGTPMDEIDPEEDRPTLDEVFFEEASDRF